MKILVTGGAVTCLRNTGFRPATPIAVRVARFVE